MTNNEDPDLTAVEYIVEKGRNCSWGAISPLIHNILLPDVRFLC